ncbi:MAG: hypothetical protein HON47_01000, partial [Candidatus Diapherotrites archaeon]|nr:hypothetical protein [Candidatus Diapherotrites archaeon]
IEYLVIIAIVIVIALVVVGLLLQVMNSGSGVPETQAKATWKSAEPIGIIDWGTDSDGNLTLVLRNNSSETIEYNTFDLSSSSSTEQDYNSTDKSIASGATYNIVINNATSCTSGNKYSYPKENIQFDYNTPNINNKTQKALADIVGTC